MQMGMKHCLPSIRADVRSNVEAGYLTIKFSNFGPRLTKKRIKSIDFRLVQLKKIRDMSPGNNQCVQI